MAVNTNNIPASVMALVLIAALEFAIWTPMSDWLSFYSNITWLYIGSVTITITLFGIALILVPALILISDDRSQ